MSAKRFNGNYGCAPSCRFSRLCGIDGLRLTLSVALLMVLFATSPASGNENTQPIRSGCEIDYPPFCIVHEDGRADGFSVELMRAALQKMGREVTFRTGPWAEVRGRLERGEVDALPLVGRTPEREQLFDFTVPYLTMHGAIVVREDNDDIHSLADLRGRRVGVMQGDNAEEFLRREERDFEIVTAPTFADSFRDLAEGRCDAVVIQRLVAIRLLEETGPTKLKIVERPIREFSQDFCFAVKEGDREMLSILNEGLALAVADGTHRRLHAKWFAHLELPQDRPIVVGGDHNYPPFEFLDEKGRPAGFTVELTRAIAREMNMDVRIELGPWKEMVNALRDGKIDALEGMFYSAERDRTLDFSPRYLVIHCVSLVRQNEGSPPTAIEELRRRDLVVQAEDAILDALAGSGIEARITTVETQEDVVRAVAEGRNACGLATRFGALYAIKKHGWTNLDVADRAFYSGEYAYAVPHGNEALLAEFTEGLRILKDSGEYQRIYEKWFGVYEEHSHWPDVLKLAALLTVPILLLAGLALLWSWSLRRQVRARTQELRGSLERFKAVFAAANVGKSMTLPTGELNVNKAFADMLGYTPEELRGKTWQELTLPEDVPETERRIAPLLDGREDSTRFEKRYVRKDGGIVWADVSVAMLRDTQNRSLHFITTVVDITERKRAEDKLRESEEYQRAMIACSPVALYTIDMNGAVLTWNNSSERIFGWSADEVIGQPLPIVPEDKLGEFEELRQRVGEGESFIGRELLRRRKDGTSVPISLSVAPVLDSCREVIGIMGAAEDISERTRQKAHIQHLNLVLRAIRDVNQLITHETDRGALLRRSCEILTSTRGYRSAWVALRGAEGNLDDVAECGIGEDFGAVRERLERGEWPECYRRAMEHPDGIAPMHDTSVNCKTCALARDYRDTAALAGRLRHAGRDFGVLVVALPEGMADDEEEQSLFRELVGDVAYALHAMETSRQRRLEEARFRTYVERAPYGIFIADRSGRYVDVNPAAADITGYSKDELLRMGIADLLPPDSRESGLAHFQKLIDEGHISEEMPFVQKNGEVRHWIVSAAKLSEDRFLGFAQDITKRKRAEGELQRTNAVLSQLLVVARRLGAAMDTETVVDTIRQAARALSGADGVTVVLREGDQCYYVDEDAIAPLWKGMRFPMGHCISGWVMQHRQSVAIEDIYADPRIPHDTYRKTFVRSLAMAPIRTHNPVGAIGAYWRERHVPTDTEQSLLVALGDMTASIWDALHAREALKRSEKTYRLLADNTVDCIWRLSLDGIFEYINPASQALLGYAPDEMIGKPLSHFCDQANSAIMMDEIATALRSVDTFQRTIFETQMLRRDGSSVWVEITGKVLRDKNGVPVALQGVTRDITERKRAENEHQNLQDQLIQAQKMESVGRLAGGVAHDFNNILQTMMGYSAMLLDVLPPDTELCEFAEEISKGAERAAALTRQLLAFARKQTISPRVLNLNETVESMLKMLGRLIGEDIDLLWQPAAELLLVRMDPGQIDQILANLCVNARDAIGGVGKVTIETDSVTFDEAYCESHAGFVPGDFVMLAVSDDGCGMDKETLDTIFEPFFTTKDLGEGTGLGLATVYGIAKQNGGFINVYSEPGEGTSFKIYLPRHAMEAEHVKTVQAAEIERGHGETVLLVEDDLATLKLSARMLEEVGYKVYTASTPKEALGIATKHAGKLHLLVTDVVMPEMNGRDLAGQVQTLCPEIRTLFVSGYTANVIAHRGVLDEGTNFLQKPFSRSQLAAKVREALEM